MLMAEITRFAPPTLHKSQHTQCALQEGSPSELRSTDWGRTESGRDPGVEWAGGPAAPAAPSPVHLCTDEGEATLELVRSSVTQVW